MLQAAAAPDKESVFKQGIIDKLTHENAFLKRMRFEAPSPRFSPEQKSLLEDKIEADLAVVTCKIEALGQTQTRATPRRSQPKVAAAGAPCRAARSAPNPNPTPAAAR